MVVHGGKKHPSVPKCMRCHKTIVVVTGRAHCFHECIYFTPILFLWDLSTLCVVDHSWPLIYLYMTTIYIYIYIYIHMVFTTDRFFEVAIESSPEWDLSPRPLNSVLITNLNDYINWKSTHIQYTINYAWANKYTNCTYWAKERRPLIIKSWAQAL